MDVLLSPDLPAGATQGLQITAGNNEVDVRQPPRLVVVPVVGTLFIRDKKDLHSIVPSFSGIRKLWFRLWRAKGVDIVVTHSPAQGYGDGEDYAHRGFECFLPFLDKYRRR